MTKVYEIENNETVEITEKTGLFTKIKQKVANVPSAVKYGVCAAAGAAATGIAFAVSGVARKHDLEDESEFGDLTIEEALEIDPTVVES